MIHIKWNWKILYLDNYKAPDCKVGHNTWNSLGGMRALPRPSCAQPSWRTWARLPCSYLYRCQRKYNHWLLVEVHLQSALKKLEEYLRLFDDLREELNLVYQGLAHDVRRLFSSFNLVICICRRTIFVRIKEHWIICKMYAILTLRSRMYFIQCNKNVFITSTISLLQGLPLRDLPTLSQCHIPLTHSPTQKNTSCISTSNLSQW